MADADGGKGKGMAERPAHLFHGITHIRLVITIDPQIICLKVAIVFSSRQ